MINRETRCGTNHTRYLGDSSRSRPCAYRRLDSEDLSTHPPYDRVGNSNTRAHPASIDLLFSRDGSTTPGDCTDAEPAGSASLLPIPTRPSPGRTHRYHYPGSG